MNKKLFMLWTFLLCFVGGVSAQGSEVFNKISSLAELTDGEYLIVGKDERAMGAISGKYFAAIEVTPSNGAITSAGEALVWTIKNVDGKYIISSEGSYVASKGDANAAQAVNAEASASKHTVTLNDDGTFSFADDLQAGRFLQYNSNTDQWRFAYYKGTQNHLMLYKKEAAVVSAVSTPTFTPAGGSFFGTQTVEIACETADAKIYYTLDGNDPTAESAEYTAPVEITETATLKAIAIKGEDKSSIAAAKYTILANIANTVDAPMTVAEALAAIVNNSAETLAHADNKVYVKGIVKYIDEISTSYGNATYSIVDAEGDADTLLIYRGKFLENAKFTAEDSAKFVPGSTVVIYGNLINYNGTTPEMTAGNYLASFEEPKAEEATWKDIKVDFTNDKILTATETNIISVGIKMNEDGTVTRVAADDASANAVVTGKYHSAQHGLANFSATVKVEGPVKIGMGTCAWGGNVTIKDENGAEVANAFNTNNGACWATANGAETNVIYTYYKGEAATLTIAGGSYTPYFSVEKIALEDIPQVMKVNYSLGETGATGILPANFEIKDGEKFATPVNRTLYAEGKTLTGWTDGTNNYTIGQEITAVADTEMTLVPVFTANNVTLDDRKDAVSIVWDFQQKNGAPVVGVQGKTMIWVAQAVVNGETIDVKMDIDATGGKVANGNWTDWAQINGGTKLTIPACKGTVIDLESYSATTNTTIAGDTINQATTTPTYTYNGEETTIDIVIGDGSYWRTVKATIPAILPENITVDVTDGDIVAAVDAAKATVAKVGDITINLKKGTTYTVSKSIEIPAGLVINGDSAKIDASALDAPFIVMSATPSVELINNYYRVGQVKISKVVVDSIKNSIFYDNNTKYCVVDFTIDNSVLNLATTAVQNEALVSFKQGGAKDFNVTNSTIYGNGVAKYFIRYENNARLDRYGFTDASDLWSMTYTNNTFYKVNQPSGQWGNYNGVASKAALMVMTIKDNIWADCSSQIMRRLNHSKNFSNFHASSQMQNNTFWYSETGSVESQGSYGNDTDLITDPTFADAATGNFTLHVGSQQAKEKTGDPRWLVEYDATQAFALPIVVDVVEGDILAAVDAAKATVDKVGDITINLAKGTTYTVSNSVLAPANLVINGDSAIIDATALAAPMIITDTVALAEWKTIETIAVNNVVVKGLGKALFQSSGKNLNITNFVVDNSIVEVAKDVTVFDFTKGSVAMNFTVKNSTLYAPTATTKSVYSSQSAPQKGSDAGATAEAPQTFSFENTTLYNLTTNKNFFTHRQNSQTWLKYVVKNNVVVNCGKTNFMTSLNGGTDSANPQYDVTTNSVGTLADGTYTDLSASQMVNSVVMGTLVTTDPQFKDAAAADFTVYAGSDQAKEKIGDPRWLVEFDETLSGIEGITTDGSSVNGANNDAWYNLQGVRVNGKPTQKGIYIHNGKKIVVK